MQSFVCMARAKIDPRSQDDKEGVVYKLCYQSDRRHLLRVVSIPRNSISRTIFPSPFFLRIYWCGLQFAFNCCIAKHVARNPPLSCSSSFVFTMGGVVSGQRLC